MESEFDDGQSRNLNDLKIDTPMRMDSYTILQKKFSDNKKSIKELEDDLRNLLGIAKESKFEYYSQIKSGLEKIKFLVEENVEFKDLLIKEFEKSNNCNKKKKISTKIFNIIKKFYAKVKKVKQLLKNIN